MSGRTIEDRAQAMAVMARASRAQLLAIWQELAKALQPVQLLEPETGMVRLTAKAGQSDVRFQFGEASCTRCIVELEGMRGYAVHLGSDGQKAYYAACLDVLYQRDPEGLVDVLTELATEQDRCRIRRTAIADATKVRFYTTKTSS